MAQLIDGKVISAQIKDEVKEKVAGLKEQGCEVTLARIPHLPYMSATRKRPANM